uniref:Phosphoenolpyruvate carboxykinase [GTP] n=1 Tax=Lygus hesperus TaxID=30085 RepID=A0A0A9W7T1_LYGHE
MSTNPSAIEACSRDTIFTNVALTDDGDVWWEGLSKPPQHLIDWQGKDWTPGCGRSAAHSNSRFTAPLHNCPILDENWNNPKGVPISAMIYGGRRESDIPLVFQTFNWSHGVYTGATIASETTSANQDDKTGTLRSDPFAMLPFCGYHMADYFKHYLRMGRILKHKPLIFHVNFFRRDPKTRKFLYPGFSDNARILKWIVQRVNGQAHGVETAIGIIPRYEDIDWNGLNYTREQFNELMELNGESIKYKTTVNHDQLLLKLCDKIPFELLCERQLLVSRL